MEAETSRWRLCGGTEEGPERAPEGGQGPRWRAIEQSQPTGRGGGGRAFMERGGAGAGFEFGAWEVHSDIRWGLVLGRPWGTVSQGDEAQGAAGSAWGC